MSGIEILLNDHRGVYIPRDFVNNFENWHGISSDDISCLKEGPENENYWDIWQTVLDNAYYIDEKGNKWELYQDGDLFTYCVDLLTDEERRNMGWDE